MKYHYFQEPHEKVAKVIIGLCVAAVVYLMLHVLWFGVRGNPVDHGVRDDNKVCVVVQTPESVVCYDS